MFFVVVHVYGGWGRVLSENTAAYGIYIPGSF